MPIVPHANSTPDDAADRGEQRALGEELPDQPAATGAQRRAQRQLAVPAQHPRQRQVGDVGAGDEQDQAGDAEQDQQQVARPFGQRRAHVQRGGLEARGRGAIDAGVIRGEALVDGGDGRGRLLVGVPVLHAAEHAEPAERAAVLRDGPLGGSAERAGQHRHVDVVLLRVVRHVGQHADDAVGPIVHLEHLADDVRIAAEAGAPVGVAEDQHRLGAGQIVGGDERAADDRLDAQQVEEVVRRRRRC